MKQSEIIEFAEGAARKIIEDFSKFEEERGIGTHWGYLDENKQVVPCRFSALLERYPGVDPLGPRGVDRRVGRTRVRIFYVSTVFLGLNHGWGGRQVWFETMVFRGSHRERAQRRRNISRMRLRELRAYDYYQQRYRTYDEALLGHELAVEALTNRTDWARFIGYSNSHVRKIRREQEARRVLGSPR